MFSNALKSLSSNISNNYTISPQPNSVAGPWRIHDAKRKQTGKAVSVFVFDKKSLEAQGGSFGARSSSSSLKKLHEEVVERLKREASSLARLRHPSILELVEPVEETRNGGLQFATEPVTASLSGLLVEKDEIVKFKKLVKTLRIKFDSRNFENPGTIVQCTKRKAYTTISSALCVFIQMRVLYMS